MTTNLDTRDVKQYCYSAEWKTGKPTEPGWYWARAQVGIYVFHLKKSEDGRLYFDSPGSWWNATMEEYKITHWIGPMTQPDFYER